MVCGTVSDILRQPYRSGLRDRPTARQAQLVFEILLNFLNHILCRKAGTRDAPLFFVVKVLLINKRLTSNFA